LQHELAQAKRDLADAAPKVIRTHAPPAAACVALPAAACV
jgi:hypothetical protein